MALVVVYCALGCGVPLAGSVGCLYGPCVGLWGSPVVQLQWGVSGRHSSCCVGNPVFPAHHDDMDVLVVLLMDGRTRF